MNSHLKALNFRLSEMSPHQRIAFAAALAERMCPYYHRGAGHDWCNSNLVTDTIGRIWAHAKGAPALTVAETEALDDDLLKFSPNMEEGCDYDALDASSVIGFALEACLPDKSATMAVSAAEVKIDHAGRSSEFEEDDAAYWQSSPVVEEVRAQQRLLEFLSHISRLDDHAIDELRALALR